jgi:hypothetical protein
MSICLFSDTSLENCTKIIKKFFGREQVQRKKYYMLKWTAICKQKMLNICLLCNWWWKLESGVGLWQNPVS